METNLDLLDLLTAAAPLLILVVTVSLTLLFYLRRGKLKIGSQSLDFGMSVETEAAELRRRISEEAIEATPAEKQYLLLREYHTQGLAQSKVSFWFSLFFASIGFVVIISAILMVDRSTKLVDQATPFVGLASGTIIEAVSALFFVQSNRARQLMTAFFDRLRTDRKLDESLKLIDAVPDEALRSRLQVLMALNLAQVDSSEGILMMVMGSDASFYPRTTTAGDPVEDDNSK